MVRPAVDVVVPFRGARAELEELRARLGDLASRPGDTLLVVDNTPPRARGAGPPTAGVPVLEAPGRPTPGFARNRGAAHGSGEWIVFLDADVVPAPDLLDRLFHPSPDERTATLAGDVRDEAVAPGGGLVARYAYKRRVSEQNMLLGEKWGYSKTTNAAVRRAAFEAVGGFREEIRAAEDADLGYRLRAAGWRTERREGALVVHRNRQSVRAFVIQRAVHGAGAAWLERNYPGAFPARRLPGLLWWALRTVVGRLASAARTRDRDALLWALIEPLDDVAFELGRRLPNRRPRWR